jgi:hypothetical protein
MLGLKASCSIIIMVLLIFNLMSWICLVFLLFNLRTLIDILNLVDFIPVQQQQL